MEDDPDFWDEFLNVVSNEEMKDADESFTPEVYGDPYLNMELSVPHGGGATPQYAKVTKQMRDANGIPIKTANDNQILDMQMYKVEFLDGTKTSLSDNYSLWSDILTTIFLRFCATHVGHVSFVPGLGWRFRSIIL